VYPTPRGGCDITHIFAPDQSIRFHFEDVPVGAVPRVGQDFTLKVMGVDAWSGYNWVGLYKCDAPDTALPGDRYYALTDARLQGGVRWEGVYGFWEPGQYEFRYFDQGYYRSGVTSARRVIARSKRISVAARSAVIERAVERVAPRRADARPLEGIPIASVAPLVEAVAGEVLPGPPQPGLPIVASPVIDDDDGAVVAATVVGAPYFPETDGGLAVGTVVSSAPEEGAPRESGGGEGGGGPYWLE
jgi:hypothetical protein